MTRRRATKATLPAIRESAARVSTRLTVDRDAGVIRGVKVLGWDSGNGRRYLPEGVNPAIYEGVSVRVNHTARPGDSYQSEDVFGRLTRPEKRADGIYADLEYLKAHTMAERVCEAVERMPGAYGLSHNVPRGEYETDPRDPNVITRVHSVHCVDLVADPATTHGLNESLTMPKTIKARDFFKGLKQTAAVKALLEDMGDDYGDVDMAEDPEEGGDYKADLLAAVAKLLDDNGEEAQGMITKIMGILKPKKEAPVEEAEGDDEEKDDAEADDEKKDDKEESLKRREAVYDLCESLDFQPTKAQRKALVALTEAADRKALITEFQEAAKNTSGVSTRPRSRLAGGGVAESRAINSAEDFAAALFN